MLDLVKLILGVPASLFKSRVENKAGSRNPGSTATDQCASPAGAQATAPQQCRSSSICLALSLVSLRCRFRKSDSERDRFEGATRIMILPHDRNRQSAVSDD